MPPHSLSIGVVVLAAAVVLPAQAQAEHENRYFGFSYQPYAYYPPPIVYPPPPGVRQTAPGLYEYEVSPGRWVRVRPGHVYQQPLRERRDRRSRTRPQPQEARRAPELAPVPKIKPEATDDPEVAIQSVPETTSPAQVPATSSANAITCEAAADIVKSFGFSDVQSTSCSGEVYGFDAARDGSAYSIKLSAADGELTEVRKR
jgi:hypothetical protein